MFPLEIEPTFSAGQRPQTYTLDRAANDTGQEERNRAIIQTNQIANYYLKYVQPISVYCH
jgi:hypothetical protein